MEPKNEAELVAAVRARRVARRETLLGRARGIGRWESPVALLQCGLVYLMGRWLEGTNDVASVALTLMFLLVAGNLARLHARIDALAALVELDDAGRLA